jgi:hypothetical protein
MSLISYIDAKSTNWMTWHYIIGGVTYAFGATYAGKDNKIMVKTKN